jgi:hypothetical protein
MTFLSGLIVVSSVLLAVICLFEIVVQFFEPTKERQKLMILVDMMLYHGSIWRIK